jgi:FAD/FMN-containing dehydrogenase/NAD-dependent dihydropyrimidine dehydrogenase PreA subunit
MRLAEEFRKIAGDIKIIVKDEEKELYSHDIGDVPPIMTKTLFETQPSFVVQPQNVDEIRKVLAFANDKKVPVIPRGAASWGFGGVIPTEGGIVIDLSPFRKILDINVPQKTVTVEAGARWSDIDIMAKKEGLCLMTYPSSKFSTVAGWISTGGYGINSLRYGHISKQIVSMTVITASGEIKKLSPADQDFQYFVSTEGEFGIVAEITLKLRDVPPASYPRILYFSSDADAFQFIARFLKTMAAEKMTPNVIRFVDGNHLYDTNKILHASVFKETAAVLLEFSNITDDEKFTKRTAADDNVEEAPRYVASYLWNERLFGMKTKRLGPTILASEVIIPITTAAAFIEKAKKLGVRFGVEMCIDSYIIDDKRALVMATFLCDSRKLKYYVNMPLVSMLTKTAVSMGAEPYGLGIWNAAFINHLYSRERQRDLKAYKSKVDPNNIMNPGKFFGVGSKGRRLPAVVFHPAVFGSSMSLMTLLSPVIGKTATLLLGKEKTIDSLDFELSTHACAKCGNCMAVCPAYLVTKNEAVTAKGKVALAKKLLTDKEVTKEEAFNAFKCMHCKACEEICQTNLELMMLWDAVEKRIKDKFGRPENEIREFLKTIDDSQDYWDMVERNS